MVKDVRAAHTSVTDSALDEMLRLQVVERGISDERVLGAMRAVPRERFFPPGTRDNVYADRPHSIGHGQTISQPYIVALMTVRLNVLGNHRVLEVGTGSGYQTAILARLAAEVFTVERVKPLLDGAFERLLSLGYRNVHFRHADGSEGWSGKGPSDAAKGDAVAVDGFDRVLIGAAVRELPRSLLLSSLVDGGQAVLPMGQDERQVLVHVTRKGEELGVEEICPCKFVRLVGAAGWPEATG